jgi:Fe-S-cluster containining protein
MVAFQVPFQVDLRQLPSIAMLGLFGTGFATFLFLAALKMIGTTRTVLLYSTNLIFGVIFAMVFLHESITAINITSILLASVGVYLLRNRLGSIGQYLYPTEAQSKKFDFKNLCNTCQTHGCCTSISSPLLFPTDLAKLKAIKKDGKKYVSEVKIKDKTVKTIKKKENIIECTFWDSKTKKCSIYNNRPFDCMIYPFDICLINGKYHWIVYSCNSKSDWKWSESYLHLFETSDQFQEILDNIEIYYGLNESSSTSKLDKFPYEVLREVNFNKLLSA